jgi:disulfide bond formation protein DsbB/mono/diheme cytochrome c family protein
MASLSYWLNRTSLYIALLASWMAMLGSLYFSEVMGYVPCVLCWYQRILMYPLAGVLAAGLLLRDRHLPKIVLPLSTLGLLIALYHYLLEKTTIFAGVEVCRSGVSCTTMWINWWGFVTIPFLSLTAFTIITVMSIVALMAGEPDEDEAPLGGRAWVPVVAVIVPVVLIYGVTFSNGWQRQEEARAMAASMQVAGISGAMTAAVEDIGAHEGHAAGEQIFREACAACHGQNAEGVPNLGNSLIGNEFVRSLNDTELLQFIRNGRGLESPENTTGLVMPPSGGRPDLSDAQLNEIIVFLRSKQ